jgi:hypothetical protein
MAQTFELACVRVCFDIDRAETLGKPHRCRHGLPALADLRQRDKLLFAEVRKGCSLDNCRDGSPHVRLIVVPSWSATLVCSRHSRKMCSLTWKLLQPPGA